jgi:hypothetical protein
MAKCCGNCIWYEDGVFRQECKGVKKGLIVYPNIPYRHMTPCKFYSSRDTWYGKIIKVFLDIIR